MKKEEFISFRASSLEAQGLRALARQRGLTVTGLLRQAVNLLNPAQVADERVTATELDDWERAFNQVNNEGINPRNYGQVYGPFIDAAFEGLPKLIQEVRHQRARQVEGQR